VSSRDIDALDALVFPGGVPSRTAVEDQKRKEEASEPPPVAWDSFPIRKTFNGIEKDFFPIGALAMALGRKPVTIRQWEDLGRLPKSQFRTKPPMASHLPGKRAEGKRLYTRAQIVAVIKAAERAGITDPNQTANWNLFRDLVVAAWTKQLRQGQR
jgi:hypothetical protein